MQERILGVLSFLYVIIEHNTQHLDGVHTCFGKVVEGLETIDSIASGDKFTISLMD